MLVARQVGGPWCSRLHIRGGDSAPRWDQGRREGGCAADTLRASRGGRRETSPGGALLEHSAQGGSTAPPEPPPLPAIDVITHPAVGGVRHGAAADQCKTTCGSQVERVMVPAACLLAPILPGPSSFEHLHPPAELRYLMAITSTPSSRLPPVNTRKAVCATRQRPPPSLTGSRTFAYDISTTMYMARKAMVLINFIAHLDVIQVVVAEAQLCWVRTALHGTYRVAWMGGRERCMGAAEFVRRSKRLGRWHVGSTSVGFYLNVRCCF
jgi:hypothetical protein